LFFKAVREGTVLVNAVKALTQRTQRQPAGMLHIPLGYAEKHFKPGKNWTRRRGDTETRSERLSSRGHCPCRSDLGARLLHKGAVRSAPLDIRLWSLGCISNSRCDPRALSRGVRTKNRRPSVRCSAFSWLSLQVKDQFQISDPKMIFVPVIANRLSCEAIWIPGLR